MLENIHKLLEEADMVVTYNGNRFDIPVLNKEFLIYGMNPPAPYKSVDLYQTVKRQFRFTSNKLDYLAQQLGLGKKIDTNFSLWVECMDRNAEAWKKMEEYNINDVVLLEKVYNKLKPWIKHHANHNLYNDAGLVCPNCGGNHYQRRGYSYTSTCKYQRYQCNGCGTWFRSRVNEAKQERFVSV